MWVFSRVDGSISRASFITSLALVFEHLSPFASQYTRRILDLLLHPIVAGDSSSKVQDRVQRVFELLSLHMGMEQLVRVLAEVFDDNLHNISVCHFLFRTPL